MAPIDDEDEGYEPEEFEDDVYDVEGREELVEDSEIEPEEEGFMQGYEADGAQADCATCNRILGQSFIEKDVKGDILRFCSERCAQNYKGE